MVLQRKEQQDDELSNLFEKNMNFSNVQLNTGGSSLSSPASALGYSSSQHYHHSAHAAPKTLEDDHMALQHGLTTDAYKMLISHHIDPIYLPAEERDHFQSAGPKQREKLVGLWRVGLPEVFQRKVMDDWQQKRPEGEGELTGFSNRQENAHSSVSPPTNVMSENTVAKEQTLVEPYMESGYEYLASRDYSRDAEKVKAHEQTYDPLGPAVGYQQALDPAFAGREWWRDFVHEQPMELQYGMFEQMSQYSPSVPKEAREDEEML